jgi:hypothetical protein
MATILRPDGSSEVLAPAGGTFKLLELQTIVGGYIQAVGTVDGRYLICNEDGKRLNLPVNLAATIILHEAGGMPDDFVVGNVLIATKEEMGGDDSDGDDDA